MKIGNSFYYSYYPYIRIAIYTLVGVFNTVLIKPEDIGTWKNYLGYLMLPLALIDAIVLVIKHLKPKQ